MSLQKAISQQARLFVCIVIILLAMIVEAAAMAPESAKQTLLNRHVDASITRLVQYAGEGDATTVELLLAAGVDAKLAEPLRGVTPLHNAAAQGHLRLVNRFIDLGADINAKDWMGCTPLINAAYFGRLDIVDRLLERDSRIDVRPQHCPTALVAAVQSGNAEVLERLLLAGADPSQVDANGQTPLMAAEQTRRIDLIEKLKAALSRAKP